MCLPLPFSHQQPSSIKSRCANCGKGEENSSKLKSCAACLSVKYCGRNCQVAHRKQHKDECEDVALFKDPPPNEDCPVCMLPLPLSADSRQLYTCCGKSICGGCTHFLVAIECSVANGNDIGICPFCRENIPPKQTKKP